MNTFIIILYAIFIALFCFNIAKDILKLYAFVSTSNSQVAAWIRYYYRLQARAKAIDYIQQFTGFGINRDHHVRDIMYYHLQLDSAWLTNYIEWGWAEAESTLSDTLDRVREFVREWTDENPYIYTSQLEQIWKVHKGSYMDRGQSPNVPTALRPEQQ